MNSFRKKALVSETIGPTEIVVISKASVVQYAKSEIELIRKKDAEHQQKSRAVKKNTR